MRLNLAMPKNWLKGIAAAPLAAALGVLSIAMTGVVVVGFGSGGRLSAISAIGLGAAAILAVLATAQASRPPKPVRISPPPPAPTERRPRPAPSEPGS